MPVSDFLRNVADDLRAAGFITVRQLVESASVFLWGKERWIRGRCVSLSNSDRETYGARVTANMLFYWVYTRATGETPSGRKLKRHPKAPAPSGTYLFQGMEVFVHHDELRRKAGPGDVAADDGSGGVAVPEHLRRRDQVPYEDGSSSPSSYVRQIWLRKNRRPGGPVWATPHDATWLSEGFTFEQPELDFRTTIEDGLAKVFPVGPINRDTLREWLQDASVADASGDLEAFLLAHCVTRNFYDFVAQNFEAITRPGVAEGMRDVGVERRSRSEIAAAIVVEEGVSQTEAAERVGISQQAVSKAMNTTEGCESQKVVVPDHLHGDHEKADFRKLSPEGQERVRQGEALNRVAIAEGVRVVESPLEKVKKGFRKLSEEDRMAFDEWRATL